jgi:hypothetical protein
MDENLEDIVRSHIKIRNPSANHWQKVYCEVCGDGSRTKGPRGGWLLNGDSFSYHCFNCGIKGSLEPPYTMSKDVEEILKSFGIPIKKILLLRSKLSSNNIKKPVEKKLLYNVIQKPDYFVELQNAKNHKFFNIAINLLESKKIDYKKYTFYLSSGKSSLSPEHNAKAIYYKNRLIIPAFYKDNIIYYQARSLVDSPKKYISVDKPRLSSMYFYDRLFDDNINRLFICEGFFDAYHLNGVSVMENYLTKEQIDVLEKCNKQKIIVPDFKGDSCKLIELGLQLGWSISLPEFESNIKDVTDSVISNGRPYTVKMICDHIFSGDVAKFKFLMNRNKYTK